MTNAPTKARPAEGTVTDPAARVPLLFLIGSGILWLVVSGVLAVITSIQLHSPQFLADCAWFTHGRAQAMRETAFIYGWGANAGVGIALWLLGRLGGYPLRALNWVFLGGAFWNLGLTVGLIGIALGDMTSFALLQLPRYVQPLMLFAYGAMSVAGVLAWSGRKREVMFASQWYAIAALFLFPWLFSAAQVVLLWAPVRGVLQGVAAGWFAQGAWTLWLAPLALAAAYYLVPKTTGRVLPSYEFSSLGFWTLIVIGGWTGGRHLIGGPTPVWIATMGIVACALLVCHYFVVALNLRIVFGTGTGDAAVKFLSFGIAAYLLGGVLDAVMAFRGLAVRTQFTLFTDAQLHLALYGAVSMIFFGAIYYLVPCVTGRGWASPAFVSGHRLLITLGVVALFVILAVGGWVQGGALLDPQKTSAFIIGQIDGCLMAASAVQAVLLTANLLLLVNFCRSACVCVPGAAPDNATLRRSSLEATVS